MDHREQHVCLRCRQTQHDADLALRIAQSASNDSTRAEAYDQAVALLGRWLDHRLDGHWELGDGAEPLNGRWRGELPPYGG